MIELLVDLFSSGVILVMTEPHKRVRTAITLAAVLLAWFLMIRPVLEALWV